MAEISLEYIDAVCLALVREFLKRKNYTDAYQALVEVSPKSNYSITSRTELIKCLHIESLIHINKVDGGLPSNTILELITKYMLAEADLMHMKDQSNCADNEGSHRRRSGSSPNTNGTVVEDGGFLIEDDLYSETLMGNGMDNVMVNQVKSIQYLKTSQNKSNKKSKPRSSKKFSRTLEEVEEFNHQNNIMHSPSLLTSGHTDGYPKGETSLISACAAISPKVHVKAAKEDTETTNINVKQLPTELYDSIVEVSPPLISYSPRPTKEGVPLATGTSNIVHTPRPPISSEMASLSTEPKTITSLEVTLSHNNHSINLATQSKPASTDFNESSFVPKPPPPKVVESSPRKVKTDIDKTTEMLRLRRKNIQRSENANQLTDTTEPIQLTVKTSSDIESLTLSEASAPKEPITHNAVDTAVKPEEEASNNEIVLVNNAPVPEADDETFLPNIISSEAYPGLVQHSGKENTTPQVQSQLVKQVISSAKVIDIQTAMDLKRLVLGSPSASYPDSWSGQNLGFCDLPSSLYGLLQHKPGPCGLISVVQAYLLIELLFNDLTTAELAPERKLCPNTERRSRLLAKTLSKILWRCGDDKKAVIALPCNSTLITGGGRFKPDGVTETLMLHYVDKYEDLQENMWKSLSAFTDDSSSGCVILLYSAILSRSIEQVYFDMDNKDSVLILDNGLCSPELVHLMLCGKAVSNPFNDILEMSIANKKLIKQGIPTRSEVGFLSLQESNDKKYQIGTFLKTPKYPVWLTHVKDHFCVVFCVNKDLISDWKAERRFDLVYYDPLAKYDQPIKLTIDTTNRFYKPPDDDEQVPPLEICLRTKWRDAHIDWNNSSPLLEETSFD